MALLQVNFYSKALKKIVPFNALIPIDSSETTEQTETRKEPLKTLYLLHGYSGNYTDWISGTKVQELSAKHKIAIIMPSGENSFYLNDTDKGELYSEYIGNEFIEFTRSMFHLSDKREDTFLGGFSMGGYGAICNGLKYSNHFGRIIAFSSALIIDRIAGSSADYSDFLADYSYYRRVFGDLNHLLGSDKDPQALIMDLKTKNSPIPKIYLACGTEDFLINENRSYHEFLESQNIDHTYMESAGAHNWDFWNEYIEKSILWTLQP